MITENWKQDAANLIGIEQDQIEEIITARNLSFSDYLDLGYAVEEEDVERVKEILRVEDLEEQDNAYAGSTVTPPSERLATQTMAQQAGTQTPAQQADADDTPIGAEYKDVEDLMPGDEVTVQDIGGNAVTTKVRASRGPGNTLVVTGKDGDAVVKKDKVVQTPQVNEEEDWLARMKKLAGISETTSAGAIASAPVATGPIIKRTPPTPKRKKKEDAYDRKKKK